MRKKTTLKNAAVIFAALFLAIASCDNDSFFVRVEFIEGVPESGTVGTPLALNAAIRPVFASNTDIVWSVVDGGTTGASISGNILTATARGTVTIRATIVNGVAEGKAYTEDFEIIIGNNAIGGGVALTITPPVKNGTPSNAESGDGNFTVGAVSWLPNDNPFESDTAYTATVTLTASEGYSFPSEITATVNDKDAIVIENTGASIKVSYTFAKTLAKDITGLTIITQPKLTYTEGDTLDLSALEVTLTFDSGQPENVAYSNFNTYGITAIPANGTTLALTHGGTPVVVNVSTYSKNTNNLTVNKRSASDITFPTAAAITYGAALSTSTLSGGTAGRGTFAWQNGTTIPTVTNSGYSVEFTPNDMATDYTDVEGWSSASNTVIRTVSITVNKAAGSAVSKPAVSSSTTTSITVSAATLTNNATGQSIEYAISTSSSGTELSYQDNTTFSGLTSGTTYYVYARSKSSTNYNAGTPNVSDGITTFIAVTLNSVTANGSSTQTTTQLTLTFSAAITGLAASDITITGVTVTKGTLSNSGSVYTLPISEFNAGGTLTVSVSKSGYTISGSPKEVTIYVFMEMVTITGGTFTMGSPTNEPSRNTDETQHSVTLSGFKMGKYEVTQEQYQAVMGSNPSNFTSAVAGESNTPGKLPVEKVSWYDALVFCNKLSVMEGLNPVYSINGITDPSFWITNNGGTIPASDNATWNAVVMDKSKNGYRLPTEAEWEYACRAGTTTAYNTGDTISENTGWYNNNSSSKTHQVGLKPENTFGLYDMHGNVLEWCWDWYEDYSSGTQTDPTGVATGTYKVKRGGSYYNASNVLRSACRYVDVSYSQGLYSGIRVVRSN
ncbi:formylglycine-generating enzyme family protein [Treponema sp. R6D11]